QMQVYFSVLNAINDDRKMYIDKYLLSRLADYNFGKNAPRPRIRYKRLGSENSLLMKEALTALIQNGKAMPDLEELGRELGMTVHEVEDTMDEPAPVAPVVPVGPARTAAGRFSAPRGTAARATSKEILKRVRPQVEQAMRNGPLGPDTQISMGFKRRMESSLAADGVRHPMQSNQNLYDRLDRWIADALAFGSEFDTADSFLSLFAATLEREIDTALNG